MNLSKYAKLKKMNKEEYKALKSLIRDATLKTIERIKHIHKTDTGVYYNVSELQLNKYNQDIHPFIIRSLKDNGVEFFENNTLYRY